MSLVRGENMSDVGSLRKMGAPLLLWQSDGKMYSLDALKIGIDVRAEELSNIYDTFIVLDDARTVGNSGHYSTSGKIIFWKEAGRYL